MKFKFFQKQPLPQPQKDGAIIQNSISFDLDANGKVYFDINVLDESKEAAEKLGIMLFMINEGYYVQHILNSLDIIMKNPSSENFAKQIISSWSEQISKEDQEDPIVSPSSFNIK